MRSRIKNIFKRVERDLDAILIYNPIHNIDHTFFYVTGIKKGIFERCNVIIYPDGSAELMVRPLEEESAKESGIPLTVVSDNEEREKWMKEKLSELDTLGINSTNLTHDGYNEIKKYTDAEIIDVSKEIIQTRRIKDEQEIKYLKKACSIASEAVQELPDYIEVGMKEYEIAAELSYLMRKKGASGDAFDLIVASGKNSAEPHYSTGERELKEGDILLMDFGALYKRYRSDLTRTYFVGEVSDKQRRMYETVLMAHEKALDEIQSGVDGPMVYKKVKNAIDETEFKGKFIHGLGHSIGLLEHDYNRHGYIFAKEGGCELEENMILTIEPGVYIPGYGGVRIEDDVRVTSDGYELLSKADRTLRII